MPDRMPQTSARRTRRRRCRSRCNTLRGGGAMVVCSLLFLLTPVVGCRTATTRVVSASPTLVELLVLLLEGGDCDLLTCLLGNDMSWFTRARVLPQHILITY